MIKFSRMLVSLLAVTFVWPIRVSHGNCPGGSPDPAMNCISVRVPCRGSDDQPIKSPGTPRFGQSPACTGNLMLPISLAGLAFFYNSQDELLSNFGDRITFSSFLVFDRSSNAITFRASDGRIEIFLPATSSPEEWRHPEWGRGEVEFFTRSDTGGFIFRSPDLSETTYDVSFEGMMLPSKIRDSNGLTTTLSYSQGLLTQIAAPSGQKWDFVYDGRRLSSLSDPDGLKYLFKYAGTSLSEISVDGWGKHTFSYITSSQPKHRALLKSYSVEPKNRPVTSYSFSYYDQGVLQRVISSDSATRFTYSPAGDTVLIERESLTKGAWERHSYSTESYTPHGLMGALLSETRTGNSRNARDLGIVTARFTWDNDGRLLEVKDLVTTKTYNWGTSNFPRTVIYGHGASFDIERQSKWPFFETSVKTMGQFGTLTTTRINYNSANKPSSIITFAGDEGTVQTHSQSFEYDASGRRVVRATTSSTDNFIYDPTSPWRPIAYWGPSGRVKFDYDLYGVAVKNTTAMGVATRSYEYGYHPGSDLYREKTEGPLGSMSVVVKGVNPELNTTRQLTEQFTSRQTKFEVNSITDVQMIPGGLAHHKQTRKGTMRLGNEIAYLPNQTTESRKKETGWRESSYRYSCEVPRGS